MVELRADQSYSRVGDAYISVLMGHARLRKIPLAFSYAPLLYRLQGHNESYASEGR